MHDSQKMFPPFLREQQTKHLTVSKNDENKIPICKARDITKGKIICNYLYGNILYQSFQGPSHSSTLLCSFKLIINMKRRESKTKKRERGG